MANYIKHVIIFSIYTVGFGIYVLIWHLDPYRHVEYLDKCDWHFDKDSYRVCLNRAKGDYPNHEYLNVELGKKAINDQFRKVGGGSGSASWFSLPYSNIEPKFQTENDIVLITLGDRTVSYLIPSDFQYWLDADKKPPTWWKPMPVEK